MTSIENENHNDESCCCSILNCADSFWEKYKHHSGKVAIGLSVLGATCSVLVGIHVVASSVALAITNGAIFFSGICYEKLKSANVALESDNQSLRRMTTLANYQFGSANGQSVSAIPSVSNSTPPSTASTQYERTIAFKPNEPIASDNLFLRDGKLLWKQATETPSNGNLQ